MSPQAQHLRVALLSDPREERWASMDLVADMLSARLHEEHSDRILAYDLNPPMVRRFSGANTFAGRGFVLDRLATRFWTYPRQVAALSRKRHFDVFHIIDHSYSQLAHRLPPERTVITCHDLDTFRCAFEPGGAGRSAPFRMMTRHILSGLQRAAHVACGSAATRDEILRYSLVPAERLSVVGYGVHPSCSKTRQIGVDSTVEEWLGVDHPDSPVLLHVGSTIARKRIDVLLETFAAVRRVSPGARLVRIGGAMTTAQAAIADALGIQSSILSLPFLSRELLAAVYRRATVLLQPSDAEGFGLPVLESMASGTAVVASDLAALREVGGAAVEYCPVGDIQNWAAQVLSILDERRDAPKLFAARSTMGLERAALFSWSEVTRKMVRVYERLGGVSEPQTRPPVRAATAAVR